MRPSARIAALIELVDQVEVAIAERNAPADVIVGAYFRARRYAGSKDRRAITGYFYDMLRSRELLLWALAEVGVDSAARALVLAFFALDKTDIAEWFLDGDQYGPGALTTEEEAYWLKLQALKKETAPIAAQINLPSWADEGLKKRYGDTYEEASKALNINASLDLRINPLKTDRDLIKTFCGQSEDFAPTMLSPLGLRSAKKIGLGAIAEYNQGLFEVQDEAAQIAALLVDAKPGMQVADICAGAGGKSLLVSAQMENKGQLYAFDISAKRLRECKKRSERSGSRNIQTHRLTEDKADREDMLSGLEGTCDRVFVDAPCSGTGTWRRSPDQRWRLDLDSLTDMATTQLTLLEEAATLVKADGRLVYMTCSVLPAENEELVAAFLEKNTGWTIKPYGDVWPDAVGTNCPKSDALTDGVLQLSPHTHGTDGFFIAIFERA